MRFADILIDLAAVVKASRTVASRHIELRARQIDRYGQTSSIARSLREKRPASSTYSPRAATDDHVSNGGKEQSHDATSQSQPDSSTLGSQGLNSSLKESLQNQAEKDIKIPPLGQQDDYRNPFRRSVPNDAATIQDQSTVELDRSAILAQLRESASEAEKCNDTGPNAASQPLSNKLNVPPSVTAEKDVAPDVDVNIFHTNRGSQMLEGQKVTIAAKRPHVPSSSPSWFKDFGHDKAQPRTEEEKQTPPIAESTATHESPTANGSPTHADLDKHVPPNKEAAPTQSQEKAEQEHARMVDEILSKAEAETKTETPASLSSLADVVPETADMVSNGSAKPAYALRESKVPSSRMSRLWNYGGLAAGMLGGAISEGFSRGFGYGGEGSVMFSPGNMERLVAKLSRMRGAALKLGQIMSFQDSKMLPAPIQEVLQRVQDRADYMPAWQRDRVLISNLGPEWRDIFDEFDETPIAAASIGQVHRATLKSTGQKVAVKIQFPGVAESIDSDLDNLSMLLTASKMLPKGLYLNKTIDNARVELGWECDYEREAQCGQRYRELLADEPDVFVVPKIYGEASGRQVLTMEFMEGVGVTRTTTFTQAQRDWIGTQILRLCLREITEFRFMQTDPNWTNFLYNARTGRLELLDFGASREFPVEFVRQYVGLLAAASRSDRAAVKELSESLGYLTGHESKTMLDAHIASILTLAEPFLASAPDVYDFHDQTITDRVKALIPVMIRERLSPPPEETYSLHRKLSGAFLLCARLGSRVRCRELFERALEKADFDV
ncbi:ABC1-domain-containing protein [Hypoxylon rubiginosum]|uniref:ABC1-domain-containing protein n=1 Tax=Hypoxylon rubiginosum TaxID=110542 RepID=A0ACC0D2J8_9PEZI|nr:ABC1-domain-containing protein [Hypoxylon rubiginosum]